MKTNVTVFDAKPAAHAATGLGVATVSDCRRVVAGAPGGHRPPLQAGAIRCGLLVLALGLLTGCNLLPEPQADPVRHFTLSAPATVAPVADGAGVRPVQLASHLRSRKMAVRVAEHEVIYLDEASWAEPLDEAILAVLRNRLGTVGGGATVAVQIQRCELVRAKGNTVELAATYTITPRAPDGAPRRGVFVAKPRVWAGKDYAQLVAQIGQAVAELGETLATVAAENK